MAKRTDYSKRIEFWNVKANQTGTQRRTIVKAAVRNSAGQFHGATNFVVRSNTLNVEG